MIGSGKRDWSTMRENDMQNNLEWSVKIGLSEEPTFKLWSEGQARVR